MVKIIETNLSLNSDDEIMDIQSRVIEVTSWDSYTQEIKNGISVDRPSCIGSLHGYSLPINSIVDNFVCNDHRMICDIIRAIRQGCCIKSKKVAYKID